jgi:hypothetical protein
LVFSNKSEIVGVNISKAKLGKRPKIKIKKNKGNNRTVSRYERSS